MSPFDGREPDSTTICICGGSLALAVLAGAPLLTVDSPKEYAGRQIHEDCMESGLLRKKLPLPLEHRCWVLKHSETGGYYFVHDPEVPLATGFAMERGGALRWW